MCYEHLNPFSFSFPFCFLFFYFLFFVFFFFWVKESSTNLERTTTVLSCNFALNYGHSICSAFLNLKYIIFSQLKPIQCMYNTMYNYVS